MKISLSGAVVVGLMVSCAAGMSNPAPLLGKTPVAAMSSPKIVSLEVTEASGIAPLADGSFLVVDDDRGLFRVTPDGRADLLLAAESEKNFGGLEGVCLSSDKRFLYCLSEAKGRIVRIPLQMKGRALKLGAVEKLGKLPTIGIEANKGWEGISIYLHQGRDLLVAVHQEHPRSVGLFELPTLEPIAMKELPGSFKKILENLSDVTIDQRNGHLWLLSGKSRRLVEIDFTPDQALTNFSILSQRELPLTSEERPEGVCFDAADRLVVVTDGSGKPGKLLRLQ